MKERRKRGPATAERAAKRPGAERQGNGDLVSGCTPENVGVTPGYAAMLEALAAPGHKRRAEMRGWLGEEVDSPALPRQTRAPSVEYD
jgi:hypothetical protein